MLQSLNIISCGLYKKLDIPTFPQYPEGINVGAIHNELYREVQNAYYTVELLSNKINIDGDIKLI